MRTGDHSVTVTLCTSFSIPSDDNFDCWCSVDSVDSAAFGTERKIPGLTAALEKAFDKQAEIWWSLARSLGEEPSSMLAHAPNCTSNASDLGLMLAWRHLVEGWLKDDRRILVICDDPWLFRELETLGVMVNGKAPGLWKSELKLAMRGLVARTRVTIRVFAQKFRSSAGGVSFPKNAAAILVYGHPTSTVDGQDGYFGNLMNSEPNLVRVLHVDCLGPRVAELGDNKRTFSLYSWGPLLKIPTLPFVRWRPKPEHLKGRFGWLVRRASTLEGGTGQAAMIAWQQWCQRAWLDKCRPRVVAWPWENHGWDRDFARHAKALQVKTIGYQHTTVARRQWNFSNRSNIDGMASVPGTLCANGKAGISALGKLGYVEESLIDVGALRTNAFSHLAHDPEGPVFVAIPFDAIIGNQMLAALRPLTAKGWKFIIKVHPMTPLAFDESLGITRTDTPLADQPGVGGVIYAATTVGLEALLGGLPTLRFQPDGLVPTDPMPDDIDVPMASAETLGTMLRNMTSPQAIDPKSVFSAPDLKRWHALLKEET